MKKSNTPLGLSLSPAFKEVVKRLRDKAPELDELLRRKIAPPNPTETNRNNPESPKEKQSR